MATFRRLTQVMLTRIGAWSSSLSFASSILNYLEVGRWLKASGFESSPRYSSRELLYAALAKDIKDRKVLYLEFGVFQGASLRSWSGLLQNPLSALHGFDSFEGLPEDWDPRRPKGTFDVQGKLPRFDDPRVSLHKGLFQNTLPAFVLPDCEQLVINLDADLYSSTKYVLEALGDRISCGTILIFDEFCDRLNELRAFDEFIASTTMKFRFYGATTNLEQVAFLRIA